MIRPLGKRVLASPYDPEETTPAGLILRENDREHPGRAVVVATGAECDQGLAAGDVVLYGRHGGSDVTCDGQKYVLLQESEIYGVLDE